MIVNYTEEGWLIITQRSHGLLASQICAHWNKDTQPARWVETLIATAEHDDANNEFEKENLLEENGGPKNFKTDPFEKAYCDYLLKMAHSKGRYIGLLISRHIQFLYGKEAMAASFCVSLCKKEKEWMAEARASKSEIDRSYQILEFSDALSLLICQRLLQPNGRKVEISKGPDGKPYELFEGKKQQLIVTPWPFEVESFTVNHETRTLGQLSFSNTEEFKDALFSAPVSLCENIISKK